MDSSVLMKKSFLIFAFDQKLKKGKFYTYSLKLLGDHEKLKMFLRYVFKWKQIYQNSAVPVPVPKLDPAYGLLQDLVLARALELSGMPYQVKPHISNDY